ncbi:leucyl/phenylalanyl-tRNA--protein transferase [Enterovirga aerilata]|nr:leucyl/phenylalanyl-tRNA--protein transferase [Enterovirga sp. DB1703]
MALEGSLPQQDARSRRAALFRESPSERLRRLALGFAWAAKPERIGGLPTLGWRWLAHLLAAEPGLPDPEKAADIPYGFAGFADELSVATLVEAYGRGLFPFCHVGPVKWWSPPQRCVVPVEELHLSKRLRSHMRQNRVSVTFDRDFESVITACAEPREGKTPLTWITPTIMRAFSELFDAGHAHSFEVWDREGRLIGGGYGVATCGVFVIESQFAREPNASKIGFAVLARHLARWGFALLDNKLMTENVARMGFRDIPRSEYLAVLKASREVISVGRWRAELDPHAAEAELR